MCSVLIRRRDEEYIKTWESPNEDFDPLAGHLLDDRLLLVPNYADSQIYLFDLSGALISTLSQKGNDPSEFLYITNLAMDEKGYGYTVEEEGNRIQKTNFNSIIDVYKRRLQE